MSKQYPRIGRRFPEKGRPCILCEERTTGKVEIQVSYMRGEDEVEPCCAKCQRSLTNEALCNLIVTKWRMVAATRSKQGAPND